MHAERLGWTTAASEVRPGRGAELKVRSQPGVVEHICNPSTREVEEV